MELPSEKEQTMTLHRKPKSEQH